MWFCHAGWALEDVDLTPVAAGGKATGSLVTGGLIDFDAAEFDDWALEAWPRLSDAVLSEASSA